MNFLTYLTTIGKAEKTATNYSGAISGVMSGWAAQNGLVKQSLFEVLDLIEFERIASSIRKLAIYEARNTKGKGMYNAALNAYADYLAEESGANLERDLIALLDDKNIVETEKRVLVSARIGQGQFRRDLLDHWGGCAVTSYQDSRLLVASHIKPWRLSEHAERLDPFNGLLLMPNLDKAFDLGYISFADKGEIWISNELEQPGVLGVNESMAVDFSKEHRSYMDFHRDVVFRR